MERSIDNKTGYVTFDDLEIAMRFSKLDTTDQINSSKEEFEQKLEEVKNIIEQRAEQKEEKLTPTHKPPCEEDKKPLRKVNQLKLQWEENRKFFREHEEEFKEKYPGLYVAVHDGQVLGTGEKLGPLAGRLYEESGVPIFASIPGGRETIQLDWPITC